MKSTHLALIIPALSALFFTACGQQTENESDLNGSRKKHFVLACDGFVFDDSDPFGRRVTFAREGTKKFKQSTDFVISNEAAEFRSIVANMAGDCINGANKISGFVANICGQINAVDPQLSFNSLYTEFNKVVYKGSWSCNLKEKSK